MNPVSVLLIEPDKLMREGLKVLLHGSVFSICYETPNLKSAESLLKSGISVDLIVVEASDRPEEILRRLTSLQGYPSDARLVVLTAAADFKMLSLFLEMGVSGVLLKDISAEALIRSLHLAMVGEEIMPVHMNLLRRPEKSGVVLDEPEAADAWHLSSREKTILSCLTEGQSNKVIARELNLTEATVKAHVKAIMRKVNAQNRTQAALWGMANGLERSKVDPLPVQ